MFRQVTRLMGNRFEFTAVSDIERQASQGIEVAMREVRRIEKLLTTFDDSSQTNEVNRAAGIRPVKVDQEMFDLVETYVAQFDGARADKPPFSIYYDDEYREKDMDVEVAVPLKYPVPENEIVRVRQLPRLSNMACAVHVGEYADIYQAYNALLAWIEANDYRMTGPIREIYLRYGADGLDFYRLLAAQASVKNTRFPSHTLFDCRVVPRIGRGDAAG
jgi:effector-binding domain-containing protein